MPSAELQAGTVVDPGSQPPLTLSPYVLRDTDLQLGPTKAYRPWFENGAWMGDLIEYNISSGGNRCTTVAVGAYPPGQTGTSDCAGGGNWSAREFFPERDQDGNLDEAASDSFWKTRRVVTTYRCLDSDTCNRAEGSRIPFWWDKLSEAQRRQIDPTTASNTEATGREASPVLNFLRGDRSRERDQGGVFRLRYSLMSDVVNARPVHLPTSGGGSVIVGANGGMVHGFNATSGAEQFAYVPSMLFGKLPLLTRSPYRHTYYADGELRGRSLPSGRHLVSGGLGAGGKGLFALDVTNPQDPLVLFELSDKTHDIGHVHGRPTISRLAGGSNFYVVSGNGYLNPGNEAALLIVNPTTGGTTTVRTGAKGTADKPNGLSAPVLVAQSDGSASHAYAGDLQGNLWRFDFTGGGGATATLIFKEPSGRPITAAPDVARGPVQSGHFVYFGTGSLLSRADADSPAKDTVYGLWDRGNGQLIPTSRLVDQNLISVRADWPSKSAGTRERRVRIVGTTSSGASIVTADSITSVTVKQPDYTATPNPDLGWRVGLPAGGERVVGGPQIRGNRLQIITLNPTGRDVDGNQVNDSWIIQFDLATGGTPNRPLFNLDDRDDVLNESDGLALTIDDQSALVYPMALNFGPGNIAQPAFARVAQELDAVFINGLILPPGSEPTGPSLVFGGNINVTTDSPLGPKVDPQKGPLPAGYTPNSDYPDDGRTTDRDIDARGPMNPQLAQDGLGQRLDGHHHSYDKVHGVNFIDFVTLEPRRGLFGLDPTKPAYRVLPELNRLTEVAGLPGSQKFMVLLTNADLSQGTSLQIGCRVYDSYDYQRIVTRYLLETDYAPGKQITLTDQNLINSGAPRLLVFRRNEVDGSSKCADGQPSTLRISMTDRVGLEDVLHGTMAGCVANSHNYNGNALSDADKTSTDIFRANPHITPNQEGGTQGYRWRNGALTMQLLAVAEDNTGQFRIQREGRPRKNNMSIPPLQRPINPQGDGGLYALGFKLASGAGPNATPAALIKAPETSGLLYESSVFWNIGDMFQFQQQGQATRCYGHPNYTAGIRNEWFGLNSAQYNGLVTDLRSGVGADLIAEYAALLAELAEVALLGEAGSERLQQILARISEIMKESAGAWGVHKTLTIADYHRLRSYAHGAQFNLDLLEIDRGLYGIEPEIDQDGTPANVADIELDLLPAAGPNYQPGRKSWMDLELD